MAPIRSAIMMLLAGEVVAGGMGEALEGMGERLDRWGELEMEVEWNTEMKEDRKRGVGA